MEETNSMRKKHLPRSVIAVPVLCIFIILFIVGMLKLQWFQPVPAVSIFDEEQYYQVEAQAIIWSPRFPEPEPYPEIEPVPVSEPSDIISETAPRYIITSKPVRMRIPALSLDYVIQSTGADSKGTMQVAPALEVISWFELSALPGNTGNAIFGGHNTWSGARSKIFTLDQLEIGDEMIIDYADGTSLRFLLESDFVYELKTAPANLIMNVLGDARVTLITCKWPFNTVTGTSDYRIVATFKEESVFTIPDPPVEPYPPRILP